MNRDRSQYGETDDEYDVALLNYLVDRILRGLRAEFPTKSDSETAPLEAWSMVGKASLS